MDKEQQRDHFLKLRKNIDKERREEAKKSILSILKPKLKQSSAVLSYMPLRDEVDVRLINELLAARRALILSRIEKHEMRLYSVGKIENSLIKGEFGFLEPDPRVCVFVESCEVALIPAIAFDGNNNRIGWGHGHFDRFLKANPTIHKIGIGFREQLSPKVFSMDEHDVPMDELCLV